MQFFKWNCTTKPRSRNEPRPYSRFFISNPPKPETSTDGGELLSQMSKDEIIAESVDDLDDEMDEDDLTDILAHVRTYAL